MAVSLKSAITYRQAESSSVYSKFSFSSEPSGELRETLVFSSSSKAPAQRSSTFHGDDKYDSVGPEDLL